MNNGRSRNGGRRATASATATAATATTAATTTQFSVGATQAMQGEASKAKQAE